MDSDLQLWQVDTNYDVFARAVGGLLDEHRDQFALMRDGTIIGFFDKPGDAYREGLSRFADALFSIQEVTDEPIDLGFWSHVAQH